MVSRLAVFFVATAVLVVFVAPARADAISTAIVNFGLTGSWADDCTNGNAHHGIHLNIAVPINGPSTYASVNIDDGVRTTVRSVVLTADPLPPSRLKLRLRIVGGDVDGGPLSSPTTNTFEQTFGKRADGGLQMVGEPPIPLKRCRD